MSVYSSHFCQVLLAQNQLQLLLMAMGNGQYRTIRAGDVVAHRRWAVRAFALTYSAVTLRLWLGVLMGAQIGLGGVDGDLAFDRAYVVVPFLCWVPNLIAAELYLRRRPA